MMTKFCIDCKYLNKSSSCYHPKNTDRDLVTGAVRTYFGAHTLRQCEQFCTGPNTTALSCGKDARWFEPKDTSKRGWFQ